MITAVGAGLVKATNCDGVSVSLTEEQRRFVQGKIQEGQFRSVNDRFQEALRVLESHDGLKSVQLRNLRARISGSIAALDSQYPKSRRPEQVARDGPPIHTARTFAIMPPSPNPTAMT
jgi:putative addiction module CopG family antidote